jgi:outer membrane receptor protein involved in Fe transport
VSARYTSTSDFGDSFDPRVGIYWKLNDTLAARGTWSRSFRAPELLQLVDPPRATIVLVPVDSVFGSFPDPFTGNRSTVYLSVADPTNPNLRPETSRSFTAGFDVTPPSVRNLRISATYFNIDYSGRIAFAPSIEEIAADPELYSEFIRLPDRATIDAIAARTRRVFDAGTGRSTTIVNADALAARTTRLVFNGLTNLASQRTSGIDATLDYGWLFGDVRMNAGMKFTYMIENDERPTPNVPALRRLDTVSYPVSLRGRAFLGAASGGWSGRLTLNYVDAYLNTAVEPDAPIDSWTTFDLVTSYRIDGAGAGLLGGVRLGLTVRNLFDADPPFVEATDFGDGSINRIDYDAANHDPFGRLFLFSLTKEW